MAISLSNGEDSAPFGFLSNHSTLLLLFSNLIVIIFAVIENWDLLTILFIYWCQSVIIGIFNFFKILTLKDYSTRGVTIVSRPATSGRGTNISMAFFFLFHYNFFHFGYFIFLFISPLFKTNSSFSFQNIYVIIAVLLFLVTHYHSYKYNKNRDSVRKPNIGTVMFKPYLRIIPMHLTIIFGGFLFMTGSLSITILVLFLSLKTLADVIMHTIEHRCQIADKIKVTLERNTYKPGEIIRGNLNFQFDRPKKARALKVIFIAEKLIMHRSDGGPREDGYVIHKSERVLCGEKEYTFENHNFKFEIPSDILIKMENWKETGHYAKGYNMAKKWGLDGLMALAILSERNNFYVKAQLDIPFGIDISNEVDINIF